MRKLNKEKTTSLTDEIAIIIQGDNVDKTSTCYWCTDGEDIITLNTYTKENTIAK